MIKFSLALLLIVAITPASYVSAKKTTIPVVARFGGECSSPFKPSIRLKQLIDKTSKRDSFPSRLPFGYSAFAFDLNGDKRDEYVVPLSCGATGNCKWGIFSVHPAKLRGTLTAWFIYIHRRTEPWSRLSTYIREGGDQGDVGTFSNRRGRYVQMSIRTEHGYPGNWQPFLKRMGIPKCS